MPLLLERQLDTIAIVELDRKQKRNALNTALRDEIELTLARLAADRSVKVVVLTGGSEMFCAGYDLKEMVETNLRSLLHRGLEYTSITYFFPKPLITAVAGFALAGGFDLALSGDVIVAAEGTRLGRPEIGWGVNPLTCKLHWRMGFARALRFTLQGATVEAHEALSLGIVDVVVPPGDLLPAAIREAELLAQHPLESLMAVKRAAYEVPAMRPRDAIAYEFGITAELAASDTLQAHLETYASKVGVLK